MGAIQKKNLDDPDEKRPIGPGTASIVRVGQLTIGRGTLEPGWRWSTHLGAHVGTPSCRVHHLQLGIAGRLRVQMDDGETIDILPGDVVDVPPGHDAWVVGDEPAIVVDVMGNITQATVPQEHERVVTTLLMSDIVESTKTAARLGDGAWRQLLNDHNRIARAQIDRFRGRVVNTTGDGFLAMFTSAQSAVRCAAAMRDLVQELGLEIRVGVHTGEVELLPDDIGGIAVHAAARITALGGPSEVIVSAGTRGLVDGGGFRWESRGSHELKGLDHPIELFLLAP